MKSRTWMWMTVVCLFAALAVPVRLAAQEHKEGKQFTTIDVPGASYTQATGINPRGDIAGLEADSSGNFIGMLLSKGVITPINVPGASSTFPEGINPRGDIVGLYFDSSGNGHGFLLSK
jgi:hypothetical protein